jgi:chorismate mutase
MAEVEKQIEELRKEIDEIDDQLVERLNERAQRVLKIRELKKQGKLSLFDPKREEEIFNRAISNNKGPLFDETLRAILDTIIDHMRELEKDER